jgi:ligand-binding sensor domain-containing protein
MPKNAARQSFCFLLLMLLYSAICTGQAAKKPAPPQRLAALEVSAKLPKATGLFKGASVGCAVQDQAGNFWFGTNGEGLFRYDGKTFTHFTEQNGLDSRYVYALLTDRTGVLWIGTKTGLCRYDGTRFTQIHLSSTASFPLLINVSANRAQPWTNGVWSMMQDRKGVIWFGADNGVYCYNGMTFAPFLEQKISNKDSLHLKSIFSFLEDRKGNIWFGSCIGEGLIRFDGKNLTRISPKGYARTQGLIEDGKGHIWFASGGKGVCRYDGLTIDPNVFDEPNTRPVLFTLLKDHAGNLWFCDHPYDRPLRVFDGVKVIDFYKEHHLPNEKIYPILADNKGQVWFSAGGMKLYSWNGKAFSTYSE